MLLPLAVGLLDSQGNDMRLSSVKDGASLHNLSSSDGDFTTTAVLHVDKVTFFGPGFNFISTVPVGSFEEVFL